MSSRRDPLTHAADESRDLYEISTWEPRSLVDRLLANYAWALVRWSVIALGIGLFLLAMLLISAQILFRGGGILTVVLFPLSVVPALAIGGYVWYNDITEEPLLYLIATFVLGAAFSTFPLITNTVTGAFVQQFASVPSLAFTVQSAHFFLVVAPGEEAAKLGAVFAFVYWTDRFDSVVDGAVYGAMAGLGFATVENFFYIGQVLAQAQTTGQIIVSGTVITTVRSLVGPGHVIWTAIAGYYLGLAKFNREYAFPLVCKGLLIAIVLHGAYNTAAGVIPGLYVFGFILVYHGAGFAYLFVILRRYRKAYEEASPGEEAAPVSDLAGYRQGKTVNTSQQQSGNLWDDTETAQQSADPDWRGGWAAERDEESREERDRRS
jgi:RsiW-degrading membrane proteinase PrsW (M82 family)